ncbi:MAG: hypothetical protein ACK55Z_08705, partial [bacterium]
NGPVPDGGDCMFACALRYQQAYSSELFGNERVLITAVEFLHATMAWAATVLRQSWKASSKRACSTSLMTRSRALSTAGITRCVAGFSAGVAQFQMRRA